MPTDAAGVEQSLRGAVWAAGQRRAENGQKQAFSGQNGPVLAPVENVFLYLQTRTETKRFYRF